MKKVLFINSPLKLHSHLLQDERSIVNLGDKWRLATSDNRISSEIHLASQRVAESGRKELDWIKSQFEFWLPIFTRWRTGWEAYELVRSEFVIKVLQLSSALDSENVKLAVFYTGIPHHIKIIVYHVACSLLQVPQVYFYTESIAGRALPFVVTTHYSERVYGPKSFSSCNLPKAISAFRERANQRLPPAVNTQTKRFDTFFAVSVVKQFLSGLRVINSKLLRKIQEMGSREMKVSEFSEIKQLSDFGVSRKIRWMRTQKDALKFYRSNIRDSDFDDMDSTDEKCIVLLSHLQPEATSFPESYRWHNNIELVMFLRGLGYRRPIFYKEHSACSKYWSDIVGPTRVGQWRSVEYYRSLLELDCRFLSENFHFGSREANNRFLPITGVGSVAIERSLFGRMTIVAGSPWFGDLPGTIRIDSIESLNKIPDHWFYVDQSIAKSAEKYLVEKFDTRFVTHPKFNLGGANAKVRISEFLADQGVLIDELMKEYATVS